MFYSRCVTRCQAEFLDCQSACPCGANCPQGCSTNDACGANKFCSYTSILVLNHKQHFRDQALEINSLDDSVSEVVFDYGLSDIEDACSVIFRGESYFLGGYQRTRQVAKIGGNGCEIEILESLKANFFREWFNFKLTKGRPPLCRAPRRRLWLLQRFQPASCSLFRR